jgi:hypothetical protein
MEYSSRKPWVISFEILKVILLILNFIHQNIILFVLTSIIFLILFFIELDKVLIKGKNLIFLYITILLMIAIIPAMEMGNRLGPTFGKKIKYSGLLWKQSINNTIKYYMAEDIIKIIVENEYSKDDVIKMLGKPHFGGNEKSDEYVYFLKNNNLFIGLDMYTLSINFTNNICDKAYIIRED